MSLGVTLLDVRRRRSRRFTTVRGLLSTVQGRLGLVLLGLILFAVLVGPLLVGHGTNTLDPAAQLRSPSLAHPLGTDEYGRDELARVLVGGRRTLLLVVVALAASLTIGLLVGLIGGVAGGALDALLLRVIDIFLTLPGLVLTLAIVGTLGAGYDNLMLALAMAFWPQYARLARSYVVAGRAREDVVAARAAGVGWPRAAVTHLLPPAARQLVVVATLDVGHLIMVITGLSFLGLGAQAPAAEWGAMLADARDYITTAPWLLAGPGVAIILCVLTANMLGEAALQVDGTGVRR